MIDLLPLLSFVLVSTFTPGPNNISSASMGVLHGYRKSLPYIAGILAGFFLMMFVSGSVSSTFLNTFPQFEVLLRVVGAVYILYLAYRTMRASYTFDVEETQPLGFANGFMLQLFNPKGMIYGLTLFSTFLVPVTGEFGLLLLAAALLTVVALLATSTWALFGTAIKTTIRRPRVKAVVNTVLALLLVYTALDILGVF